MDLHEFFNDIAKNGANPAVIEEFIHPRFRTFEFSYLRKVADLKITSEKIAHIMKEYTNDVIFPEILEDNEVTYEEFSKHYVFAKYPNVRGWIGYFWDSTGMLLTREKLFDYIQRSSKSNSSKSSFAPN